MNHNQSSSGNVMAPEQGLVWSLLLTPAVGGIFWAVNWKRLGRPQHQWWSLLSGFVILFLAFWCIRRFGNLFLSDALYLGWTFWMYRRQRNLVPGHIFSHPARVVAVILSILLLISMVLYSLPKDDSGITGAHLITITPHS